MHTTHTTHVICARSVQGLNQQRFFDYSQRVEFLCALNSSEPHCASALEQLEDVGCRPSIWTSETARANASFVIQPHRSATPAPRAVLAVALVVVVVVVVVWPLARTGALVLVYSWS